MCSYHSHFYTCLAHYYATTVPATLATATETDFTTTTTTTVCLHLQVFYTCPQTLSIVNLSNYLRSFLDGKPFENLKVPGCRAFSCSCGKYDSLLDQFCVKNKKNFICTLYLPTLNYYF